MLSCILEQLILREYAGYEVYVLGSFRLMCTYRSEECQVLAGIIFTVKIRGKRD